MVPDSRQDMQPTRLWKRGSEGMRVGQWAAYARDIGASYMYILRRLMKNAAKRGDRGRSEVPASLAARPCHNPHWRAV